MNPTPMSAPPPGGLTASALITDNPSEPVKPAMVSLHPITFTGSGSEYFRIWIVNILLLLVTFGLYYPWAKVRKLRYFHGNTFVAGSPLDFHGNPRQMLRGFLLVSLLMLLYSVAGQVSATAGSIAGLILGLLWPALLRASLQFRLANTSWRGLRFSFTGPLKGAYMVYLTPMLAMGGIAALGGLAFAILPKSFGFAAPFVMGLVILLGMAAMVPYVWWRFKQYQHSHYALGQLQTQFKAGYKDVLGVFLRTGLIGVLGLVAGLGCMILLLVLGAIDMPNRGDRQGMAQVMTHLVPVFFGVMLLAQLAQWPYFTSRMQNLVWTQTGNRQVRFKSHLRLLPLIGLTVKNWVLVILTLGLYWPFAAIALARIKLEAIVVHTRQDPDLLVAQAQNLSQDAAGDLAADLIGIDIGL